jgi:quinol monooxygenase YgiN
MVRIIIERRCQPHREIELLSLLIQLRIKTMNQHGYVSGETLRSVDDPPLWAVISTWLDADLWKVWETSPERQEITSKIKPLLLGPERVSVFRFVRQSGAESAHTIDR